MTIRSLLAASAAALALAGCGDRGDRDDAENRLEAGAPITNNAVDMVPVAANAIEYANLVAGSDLFEIQSAELAIDRSQNDEVRELAQTILRDHRQSTERLTDLAGQANPPVTVSPQLDSVQQANMDALRGARGADFDRLYLTQQVRAHEKALALVSDYAANGEDAAMRQHAATVEGPIEQHLATARRLAEAMPAR